MSKMKGSCRLLSMLKAQTRSNYYDPHSFKGQEYIPHKPRNNRKTKKGSKR